MSETVMWLYPVAVASVIGLFINMRFGWRWTWGICIQQALILIASILGFVFLYAPLAPPYAVSRDQLATYSTIAAWGLFAYFNLLQKMQLSRLSLDLSLFRVRQAMDHAKLVRFTLWGPPGQYWYDIASALNEYNDGNIAGGDTLVEKWRTDPRLPPGARESLVGFHMLGRVLLGDWHWLVSEFEANQIALAESRTFVPYQLAARAYAELGRYAEAEECIRKANMQPGKTSATNLDINFMTLFALFGAIAQLEDVLKRCRDFRALPPYVRDYWRGRCYAVRGDAAEAVKLLERSRQETPVQVGAWYRRIDKTLATERLKVQGAVPTANAAADPSLAKRAQELYGRLRTIIEVLRPQKIGNGVVVTLALLVVAFVISMIDTKYILLGQLNLANLRHGDYYRTISYQFLHGNTAHLLLNCFALILFGRSVENIYGTWRFFIIFFVSGILSGVLQVVLIPNDFVIGASGSILGVFGAATAGVIKLKKVLPPAIRRQELRWMGSIALAQVVFDQIVNGIAALTDKSPNGVRIGAFAHLGGMIFGFIIGLILPLKTISPDDH